jgi:diguanylate cyclase (GGDEF)-like protein
MERTTTRFSKDKRSHLAIQLDEALRRLMDVILSLLGIIALAPVFLLVSIAIKRSSPGPVFYWGPRAGKNGKVFKILKFRTMYERKESYDGPKVTPEDDPRITPLGRILRQTKINELPQLWNVLIGDMSLVGPRPEDPTIAQNWPKVFRDEILSVRPGITSPASVVYRNEEDLLQSSNLMDTYLWDILPSKLRLDQIYVRNRSILSDLDVIFWTIIALIPRLREFSVPEHLLYWGPLSQFTSRYLWWFFVDFIIAFLAVGTAGILRRLTTPLDLGLPVAAGIALVIALLFSLINALVGLNRINWSKARTQEAIDLVFSASIVTALVFVANLVFPSGTRFPISVILVSGLMSYLGFIAVRYRSRLLTGLASRWLHLRGQSITTLGEPVLIVGAGEVARFAIWLLSNENLSQAFTIVGMVDDDPRKVGSKIDGYTVISTTNGIPDMVKKHDIGLILFAISDIQPTEQERILALCQATAARIIPVPDVLDNLRAQFPKNETEREVHFNKVLHNATIDRLTGAYNRPQFQKLAEVEFTRSLRYGRPITLVTLSISYTQSIKASYVRTIEAQLLQFAARRCMENIRGIDLLGRFDDNLLVVLLPETDVEAAELVAQRLKERISGQTVSTNLGEIQTKAEINLITAKQGNYQEFEELIADALGPVKQTGRARSIVAVSNAQLK